MKKKDIGGPSTALRPPCRLRLLRMTKLGTALSLRTARQTNFKTLEAQPRGHGPGHSLPGKLVPRFVQFARQFAARVRGDVIEDAPGFHPDEGISHDVNVAREERVFLARVNPGGDAAVAVLETI